MASEVAMSWLAGDIANMMQLGWKIVIIFQLCNKGIQI